MKQSWPMPVERELSQLAVRPHFQLLRIGGKPRSAANRDAGVSRRNSMEFSLDQPGWICYNCRL